MKIETKNRKKAIAGFRQISASDQMRQQMHDIIQTGTTELNQITVDLGRQLVEAILYIEREERAGPDYPPRKEGLYKWASQPGSVYIAGQKVRVERPRLRGRKGEVNLQSYRKLNDPEAFSEQLLGQSLAGLSARRYGETGGQAAEAFGVSPSAISGRLVEATSRQLQEFRERRLEDFVPFAVFLDTIHRGGQAFVVGLGLDVQGQKKLLGFWEGATENSETAQMLLGDLENRGLKLGAKILFIIDGGKGTAKALKDRYGRKLVLQRCTIHKDRNLQAHLPKRYRAEAHRRFRVALERTTTRKRKRCCGNWSNGCEQSMSRRPIPYWRLFMNC